MYRFFPAVRMTALRFVVILTAGKNLYKMCRNSIPNPLSYLDLTMMNPGLYLVYLAT